MVEIIILCKDLINKFIKTKELYRVEAKVNSIENRAPSAALPRRYTFHMLLADQLEAERTQCKRCVSEPSFASRVILSLHSQSRRDVR